MLKARCFTELTFLLLFIFSCGEPVVRTHLIFIDYSRSAATFEPENRDRLIERISLIWKAMNSGESMIIYPIHLLSETAAPLYRTGKPFLEGDLNYRRGSEELAASFEEELRRRLFEQVQIPDDVKGGTNLYPIPGKIRRHQQNGPVNVLIISDMIHEFMDEHLDVVFGESDAPEPRIYAGEKADELKFGDALAGSAVTIAIPGTYRGDSNDELVRTRIVAFWEELFALSGATVQVEDL